jgi:predicted amidophosphoribosyltransferase
MADFAPLPLGEHGVAFGSGCGCRAVRVMMTEPQRTCPSCGSELSGAMEFCPVCMLQKAHAGAVASGESSVSEDTIKPRTSERRRNELSIMNW